MDTLVDQLCGSQEDVKRLNLNFDERSEISLSLSEESATSLSTDRSNGIKSWGVALKSLKECGALPTTPRGPRRPHSAYETRKSVLSSPKTPNRPHSASSPLSRSPLGSARGGLPSGSFVTPRLSPSRGSTSTSGGRRSSTREGGSRPVSPLAEVVLDSHPLGWEKSRTKLYDSEWERVQSLQDSALAPPLVPKTVRPLSCLPNKREEGGGSLPWFIVSSLRYKVAQSYRDRLP